MDAERRIMELSLDLPPAFRVTGVFRPLIVSGGLVFIAGHGPLLPNGKMIIGRIGAELDTEAGSKAARQTGLSILATLKEGLGNLTRVHRLVKTLVMVNCVPEFTNHPQVADGFSRLFADVFGEDRGVGARSAVGMSSLPKGIPVEIEAIVEIE
jgi:enamine deaminase RidA (YjgF/YER057c/UK114 family)